MGFPQGFSIQIFPRPGVSCCEDVLLYLPGRIPVPLKLQLIYKTERLGLHYLGFIGSFCIVL